jgi:hypothetical protein
MGLPEGINGTTDILTHAAGYFLEPHTRRLTFWGTHMPCVRNFAGAYLNTRGSWVVALPHLLLMETPLTLLQHERLEYTQGELRVYDPSHGGIYDKGMVRAMEQFSQTRRLTNNVGTVLAEQGSKFQDPSHISPHDLWQEIPVISFSFLGWLGDLLDHWGTALAAITLLQGPLLHIRPGGTVSGSPPNLGLPVSPLGRRPPLCPPVDGHPTGTWGCMARDQGRQSG